MTLTGEHTNHDALCEAQLDAATGRYGDCGCAARAAVEDPLDGAELCPACGQPFDPADEPAFRRSNEGVPRHIPVCPPRPMGLEEALAWAGDILRYPQQTRADAQTRGALMALSRAARTRVVPDRNEVAVICGSGMRISSQIQYATGSYQVTCTATPEFFDEINTARGQAGLPPLRRRR